VDSERELEVIRDEMEQTRANLADKLGALEEQVRDTVSSASETVSSTVEGVKDVVSNVTETVENVTDTFNVSKQIEQHPWIVMGVAVAAGFAAAQLLGSSRPAVGAPQGPQPTVPPPEPRREPQRAAQSNGPSLLSQAASALPSIESIGAGLKEKAASLVPNFDEFGPELKQLGDTVLAGLGGLAVGGVMNLVRELAADAVPDAWRNEVTKMIDDVTTQLGGKPLPGRRQDGEKQPDQQHKPAEGQGAPQQKPNEPQGQGNATRGRREGRNQLVGQG